MPTTPSIPSTWTADMVAFCQQLIRTPSLSSHEGEVAAVIEAEMKRLRFDEVWVDEVGSVVGKMKGGGGPSILFNCHMDQVDIGDRSKWAHDPFGGEIVDGAIWGRGASDTKGAMAAQIHAIARAREAGLDFPGDVYMACVIQEETGGWGTCHLITYLKTDMAVLGEATANQIANGHRGRTEFLVEFEGKGVHASAARPEENALYPLAAFLQQVAQIHLARTDELGSSSLTPTRCYTDQLSSNMTPAKIRLHLDWRSVPTESRDEMLAALRSLAQSAFRGGVTASVELACPTVSSYNGVQTNLPIHMPGFLLAESHRLPSAAQQVLEGALRRRVDIRPWSFATDGGALVEAGIPTIGFSPAEEQYAHTVQDQVSIARMTEALAGNIALATELPKRLRENQ